MLGGLSSAHTGEREERGVNQKMPFPAGMVSQNELSPKNAQQRERPRTFYLLLYFPTSWGNKDLPVLRAEQAKNPNFIFLS